MQTIKLYDTNPYDQTFECRLVQVRPGETPGTTIVIPDQSLFFPEEGGQTPDQGTLAGYPVLDVQISGPAGEELIAITLDTSKKGQPLTEGLAVSGVIDWAHRYSNMQNHSGEHILSGLLHSLYGYENVGFRLSEKTVTLDTSGQLDDAQILDLERRANEIVWKNVPITCEYPEKKILDSMDYRSKIELTGPVRIVTIEGVDVCACCAPHVQRTGEIGLIKIVDVCHNKNDMRLTIVCGARALEEIQMQQAQLTQVSHQTKVPRAEAGKGVQVLLDSINQLKESRRDLQLKYIDARLALIEKTEEEAGLTDRSSRDLWIFEDPMDNLTQRNLMNQLCEKGYRFAGVFAGSNKDGWNYLIGSRNEDARSINTILRDQFGARGGGKPAMVQGSVQSVEEEIRKALG